MPPKGKGIEERIEKLRERANESVDAPLIASPWRHRRNGDQPIKMLFSYHYWRNADVGASLQALTTPTGPPMIFGDCGAYSAMSMGAEIDMADYAAWVRQWMKHLAVYVNLDVIGDAQATALNQRRMEEEFGLNPIPVVHGGTPIAYVESICERYPYVALGGMAAKGRATLHRWLVGCFQAARRKGAVFHGFGQTRPEVIGMYPWYSSDSSTWVSGARYGQHRYWDEKSHKLKLLTLGEPWPEEARRCARDAGVPVDGVASRDERYNHLYLNRANAWAWWQMEDYLRRRHGPIRTERDPRTMRQPGTHVYLVAGAVDIARSVVL